MKQEALTWAIGTAVIGYAVAALVVAVNPGEMFTNWFASMGQGSGAMATVSYSLWDSMSSAEQAFVVVMFALPCVGGIAVSQMRPQTPAAITVVTSLAVGIAASFAAGLVSRSMMGGDNAVAESMRELAKFLAVAIVPAGLATAVAVSSQQK